MRPVGWRYESWRHGLAAKGVRSKSNYFARKPLTVTAGELLAESRRTDIPIEQAQAASIRAQYLLGGDIERRKLQQQAKLEAGLTPRTLKERLAEEEALEAAARGGYVDRSSTGRIVSKINAGVIDGGEVGDALASATPSQRLRIQNALNAAAINAASLGQEFPKEFQDALTNDTKRQIAAIVKERKELYEGPLKSALKEEGKEFAIESEKAIVAAPGQLIGGIGVGLKGAAETGAEGLKSAKAPAPGTLYPDIPGGIIPGDVLEDSQFFGGDVEKARKESLFFGGNPVTTAGEQENKTVGKLSPLSDIPADAFNKKASEATNRESELLNQEVGSLWGARAGLAAVSLKSYDEGKIAFKKGNRENLIKAINDLDAEEQKIRDRWMLVEQTRAFMLSPRTRASALRSGGNGFDFPGLGNIEIAGFGGSAGGDKVAENTERINQLKHDIKDAHNEVFARKTDLRFKLRRMDAAVPPQSDVPGHIDVFRETMEKKGIEGIPDAVKPSVALRTAFGPRGE